MEFFSQLSVTEVQERIAKHTQPFSLRHRFLINPRNQQISKMRGKGRIHLFFSGKSRSSGAHAHFYGRLVAREEGCVIRGRLDFFRSKLLPFFSFITPALLLLIVFPDCFYNHGIGWFLAGAASAYLFMLFRYRSARKFQERELIRFIETHLLK